VQIAVLLLARVIPNSVPVAVPFEAVDLELADVIVVRDILFVIQHHNRVVVMLVLSLTTSDRAKRVSESTKLDWGDR
jgi:hypothetical protein